jgi:hypothetical protein
MATDQNVSLSISDPVSADIQAVCKAVESVFNFLATAEGQKCCESWRASSAAWNAAIVKAGAWIEGLFKRQS